VWLSRALIVGPYIALCRTEREFHTVLRHIQAPKPYPPFTGVHADATTHFVETSRGTAAIVCTNVTKRSPATTALLVHEAVRIWQQHRDDIWEKSPSHEFEAYAVQHIAQELMTAFERKAGRK